MGEIDGVETAASDPGGFRLSRRRYKKLRGGILGWLVHFVAFFRRVNVYERVEDQLKHGDTRAAVVMRLQPLLVAAYTDELDCVTLLKFPQSLVREFDLSVGSRLLTCNYYHAEDELPADMKPGSGDTGCWTNFHPIIADFLSDDQDQIERRKREIAEDEWARCNDMGKGYLRHFGEWARDGNPLFSDDAPDAHDD